MISRIPLLLIIINQAVVPGAWSCDPSEAMHCIDQIKAGLTAGLTSNLSQICSMRESVNASLDSCMMTHGASCDEDSFNTINSTVTNIKMSLKPYDIYCQPGCEEYQERQTAISQCVNSVNYTAAMQETRADYRRMCETTQDLADCVLGHIGNCSELQDTMGPQYRQSAVNQNVLFGCTIRINGELPTGGDSTNVCGQMHMQVMTASCFSRSMREYGLDVEPGSAGGVNVEAFLDFIQAFQFVGMHVQQDELCGKVSYEGLMEGVDCVKSLTVQCNRPASQITPNMDTIFEICNPACEKYTSQVALAKVCLFTSPLITVEETVLRESLISEGEESQYCKMAESVMDCVSQKIGGCILVADMVRSFISSDANSTVSLVVKTCNIQITVATQPTDHSTTTTIPSTDDAVCENQMDRMALMLGCYSTSQLDQVDNATIWKSLETEGKLSQYCRMAEKTLNCALPHIRGCPEIEAQFQEILKSSSDAAQIRFLLDQCEINIELQAEEKITTPSQNTVTKKATTSIADHHLAASLVLVSLLFFSLSVLFG